MTSSQSAFSASDDVISITDGIPQVPVADPRVYFEISRCTNFINDNGYENVVLQFPDELMSYSAKVLENIQKCCHAKLYILGDTSYGSCCVDEVAASHVNADAIIHFGHSCLSCTQTLPVLYIFGRKELDKNDFFMKLGNLVSEQGSVVLFYDVLYHYMMKEISLELQSRNLDIVLTVIKEELVGTNELTEHNTYNENDKVKTCTCFGRYFSLKEEMSSCTILYLGHESYLLTNLIYKYSKNKVFSYNPSAKEIRLENASVNRSLMKRYYLIEKAKDANIVGIIMGTLGVSRYKEIVKRLKEVLQHKGKRFYTFVIGKINVAKMANFMEIDVFVLVACPENSLIDSKEFFKPILTPFEIEIACLENRSWTGDLITDYSEILPGSETFVDIDDKVSSEPEYSFITGQMRTNKDCCESDKGKCTDLITGNKEKQVTAYSAEDYFSARSWQGLEVALGNQEVKLVEQGRSGIAMEYRNEDG